MATELSDIPLECVMFNLRRATRLISRRYEDAMRPVKLKAGQFSILVALAERPETPLGALADGMGMERTTLTRNLRPLLRRGLLVSEAAPDDGRVRLLSLTDEGREVLEQARPLWAKAQAESFARLPAELWPDTRRRLEDLAS